EPKTERSLAHVWENPLGFTVSAYRVDAETLETNP
ncbi:MAG: type IV secretion system protein, partial [Rhodobacter sp.]|nr:type IV secretion system protein [Rhodobacter sp.]